MRDRHNIVGSEVGRPRPPYYVRADLKLRTTPGGRRWSLIAAVLALAFGGFVLAVLL